jgi:hypothetical protein
LTRLRGSDWTCPRRDPATEAARSFLNWQADRRAGTSLARSVFDCAPDGGRLPQIRQIGPAATRQARNGKPRTSGFPDSWRGIPTCGVTSNVVRLGSPSGRPRLALVLGGSAGLAAELFVPVECIRFLKFCVRENVAKILRPLGTALLSICCWSRTIQRQRKGDFKWKSRKATQPHQTKHIGTQTFTVL